MFAAPLRAGKTTVSTHQVVSFRVCSTGMENRPHSPTEVTHLPHQGLSRRSGDEFNGQEEDEEEVDELEEELNEMAQKLFNYRSTLPDQLSSCLASVFAAQRPQFPLSDRDSEPGYRGESCEGLISAVEDQETANDISLLKEKISSNLSAMPLVVKRMNECSSRIIKLSSCSDIILPAFKRAKKRQHRFS